GSTSPPTNSTASQTFTLPAAGITSLVFSYKDVCPDTVYWDWFTATLTDNTAQTTYTVIPNTCANTGMWSLGVFPVSELAGHNVTLTFTNHDDAYVGDESYVYIDDVAIH